MPNSRQSRFLAENVPRWVADPVLFCQEVMQFDPDPWQADVLRDLADENVSRISVKSGQGVGKTGIEACALVWFMLAYKNARVVATAPTKRQLNDVLWPEASKWMGNSPLLEQILRWTKTYIYVKGHEKRWFAVARTATKPENMQGFHEENMLFLVDEASGVADPIMEAILGTLTGENNKLVLMGNPTRTSGTFYESHTTDRNLYKCYTISSRNSPRTSKDNIASLERKYGKDSNVVRVRVDGEFPEQEDDVFIPLSWLEQSINTEYEPETEAALRGELTHKELRGGKNVDAPNVHSIDIGCDVARFGDDKTAIGYKINEVAQIYKKYNGQDITWTAGNVARLYQELKQKYQFKGPVYVKIDDSGVGGGVTDMLKGIKRGEPDAYDTMIVVPIHFGVTIKHKNYYDSTTFMMGTIRDMIQPFDDAGNPRKPQLIIVNDDDLIAQLSCRKYAFQGAKVKVESKKEMKERGLTSPDEADCMLLTCHPVRRER